MLDLLDRMRADIDERLRELRPAVEEYETLERARELLAGSAGREPRQGRRMSTTSASRAQRPLPRGERTSQILNLLRENPEMTPRELAGRLDTTRQNISVTLGRLKKQGVLDRQGDAWVILREPQ